jgi:hypothetical protein
MAKSSSPNHGQRTKEGRAKRAQARLVVREEQNAALLKPSDAKRHGRPTEAQLYEVFDLMSSGKSMRQAAIALGFDQSSTSKAIRNSPNPDVQEDYEIAKEQAAAARFDKLGQVAQLVLTKKVAPDIGRAFFDIEKWSLSKIRPIEYGDKTEISGPGGAPLQAQQAVIVVIEDNGRPRTIIN